MVMVFCDGMSETLGLAGCDEGPVGFMRTGLNRLGDEAFHVECGGTAGGSPIRLAAMSGRRVQGETDEGGDLRRSGDELGIRR